MKSKHKRVRVRAKIMKVIASSNMTRIGLTSVLILGELQ